MSVAPATSTASSSVYPGLARKSRLSQASLWWPSSPRPTALPHYSAKPTHCQPRGHPSPVPRGALLDLTPAPPGPDPGPGRRAAAPHVLGRDICPCRVGHLSLVGRTSVPIQRVTPGEHVRLRLHFGAGLAPLWGGLRPGAGSTGARLASLLVPKAASPPPAPGHGPPGGRWPSRGAFGRAQRREPGFRPALSGAGAGWEGGGNSYAARTPPTPVPGLY